MILLTSQKDELFKIISDNNLSPSLFEFEKITINQILEKYATKLKYKHSDFYFIFDTGEDMDHYSIFSPGKDKFVQEEYPHTWDIQKSYFTAWIKFLIREINTPNYWERFEKEIKEIRITEEGFIEDKFNATEFEEVKIKIDLIKNGLLDTGINQENINIINKKLDDLTELSKTMNKFDWKSLFIGTIINLTMQLTLTPENSKNLWLLIKNIFKLYFIN